MTRVNKTPFIKRSEVKKLALDLASRRHHVFTRVSAELFEYLNDLVRTEVLHAIDYAPSIGKTVYPPRRVAKEHTEEAV